MLAEYFTQAKILLNFEAKDYRQALKKMLALSSEKNHPQVLEMIMKREALMPTALGKGIALPRIILDDKEATEMVIALSPKGINANSFDHLPVKIVFLFLFSKMNDYTSILAQSLRLLNDDSMRTELLQCKTADEIIKAIRQWEEG